LSGERVKVLDFGLAVGLNEATAAAQGPNKSRVAGTLAYASPEQRLHRELDNRSDLYSLGLILRELLTLRTPVEQPAAVLESRDDVPPEVLKVLDKALRQDPIRRWQNAASFRAALQAAYDAAFHARATHASLVTPANAPSLEGMVRLPG